MEEYKMLREELLNFQNRKQTTIHILYTGVAAILTLGISIEDSQSLIFLLPFCVIIPTYTMAIDFTRCIKKIGAYLEVFHENDELKWESRLSKFDATPQKLQYSTMFSFYILGFISLGLFLIYFDLTRFISALPRIEIRSVIELIIFVVLFGVTLFWTITHKRIGKIKGDYVLAWRKVAGKEMWH